MRPSSQRFGGAGAHPGPSFGTHFGAFPPFLFCFLSPVFSTPLGHWGMAPPCISMRGGVPKTTAPPSSHHTTDWECVPPGPSSPVFVDFGVFLLVPSPRNSPWPHGFCFLTKLYLYGRVLYRAGRGAPGGLGAPPNYTCPFGVLCCVVLWGGYTAGGTSSSPWGGGRGDPPNKGPPSLELLLLQGFIDCTGGEGGGSAGQGHTQGRAGGLSSARLGPAWLAWAKAGSAWCPMVDLGQRWLVLTRLGQRWLVSAHLGSHQHLLANLGTAWPTLG